MLVPFVITYIGSSVLVSLLALRRRISITGAFLVSLFMSPIIGLITILKSQRNIIIKHYNTRYICPECNTEQSSKDHVCGLCDEMGKKIEPKTFTFLING